MSLVSVKDVFKIAIGPSSSHTLGALKSAKLFLADIKEIKNIKKISIELLGSFALTGKGHLTDKAIIAGLSGFDINNKEDNIKDFYNNICQLGYLIINNNKLKFNCEKDIISNPSDIEIAHPNTVIYNITTNNKQISKKYYSVGGGIVLNEETINYKLVEKQENKESFTDILKECDERGWDLLKYMLFSEEQCFNNSNENIRQYLSDIWKIMNASLEKGLTEKGIIEGGLNYQRRAKEMITNFTKQIRSFNAISPEITLCSIYAISVSEENASGNRVVTAPTCGSAGIIPAVLKTLQEKLHKTDDQIVDALIVGGLIGALIMENGSISGAEIGCQGEIGSASSMAAAAATYLLGGNNYQIEAAAEISLEHHLGLTCDPIGGLVQVPCIERNAVGAVTALNASNIALLSYAGNILSFDSAVKTMKQTGMDMNPNYKETSLGGLAKAQRRKLNNL